MPTSGRIFPATRNRPTRAVLYRSGRISETFVVSAMAMRGLRRVSVAVLVLLSACDKEESDPGIPLCTDCENALACPTEQPSINPLETCEEMNAECFYCSTVTRRFVCQGAGESDGDLRWRDNGVPDMCPPPSQGTGTTG